MPGTYRDDRRDGLTRASRASQAEIREKEGIDKRQAERDEWSEVAAVRVGQPQPQLSG